MSIFSEVSLSKVGGICFLGDLGVFCWFLFFGWLLGVSWIFVSKFHLFNGFHVSFWMLEFVAPTIHQRFWGLEDPRTDVSEDPMLPCFFQPWINIAPEMAGWNTRFLVGWPIFSCELLVFRECRPFGRGSGNPGRKGDEHEGGGFKHFICLILPGEKIQSDLFF